MLTRIFDAMYWLPCYFIGVGVGRRCPPRSIRRDLVISAMVKDGILVECVTDDPSVVRKELGATARIVYSSSGI